MYTWIHPVLFQKIWSQKDMVKKIDNLSMIFLHKYQKPRLLIPGEKYSN